MTTEQPEHLAPQQYLMLSKYIREFFEWRKRLLDRALALQSSMVAAGEPLPHSDADEAEARVTLLMAAAFPGACPPEYLVERRERAEAIAALVGSLTDPQAPVDPGGRGTACPVPARLWPTTSWRRWSASTRTTSRSLRSPAVWASRAGS